VSFWRHNHASDSQLSDKSGKIRAVERCDSYGGSFAITDEDKEAWLFDCPQFMTPIDINTATPGRSIQCRPWQLNLKPTICESVTHFCNRLLPAASNKTTATASSNVVVMYSDELDAVLHRCGVICLVLHGNGDWSACHSSHVPSSFQPIMSPSKTDSTSHQETSVGSCSDSSASMMTSSASSLVFSPDSAAASVRGHAVDAQTIGADGVLPSLP
jgi:hypothetical protein